MRRFFLPLHLTLPFGPSFALLTTTVFSPPPPFFIMICLVLSEEQVIFFYVALYFTIYFLYPFPWVNVFSVLQDHLCHQGSAQRGDVRLHERFVDLVHYS
jgi:hypothetical protein